MDRRQINRAEGLDWLRGLMALSIMFYHYVSWSFISLPAYTILGKLGIYAVSIFFILSGLSLAIAYNDYIKDIKTSLMFFIRRIFRIWPVLWLAVAIAFNLSIYYGRPTDPYTIAMNLTTLFGFFDYGRYILAGAWSIGNEMVYYAVTPLIIALYNKRRQYGNIFFGATVLIGLVFAFYFIDGRSKLASEWNIYINPINNLFLFVAGIAIYYNFKNINLKRNTNLALLISSALLFSLMGAGSDPITIVSGVNRVIFSLISMIAVISFWKMDFRLTGSFSKTVLLLCFAAYPIYLLHPLMQEIILVYAREFFINNPYLLVSASVAATVVVSVITYKYIERPFIVFGKKITNGQRDKTMLFNR